MATYLPPLSQARGLGPSLPPCGETPCNGRGTCQDLAGGEGGSWFCDCILGYKGDRCEDTVNESLSVGLTIGVLSFILGIIFIAFFFAKIRQTQKRRKRSELMTRGYRVDV